MARANGTWVVALGCALTLGACERANNQMPKPSGSGTGADGGSGGAGPSIGGSAGAPAASGGGAPQASGAGGASAPQAGGASGSGAGGSSGVGGGAPTDPLGTDRAAFFGASRCGPGAFLLCDGFEGGALDAALWQLENSGTNTVALDTQQAARGSSSLRIVTHNGFGLVRNSSVFPVANNTYWARMFLRVARFSNVAWAHWTVAEARGQGDGSLIRVGGQYDTNQQKNRWGVGSDGGPTGDWTTRDNDPNGLPLEPPVGEWVCLEWLHDGSANESRFFVDAVEHPSLSTTSTRHGGNDVAYLMPQFQSVWFGWWQYQADPEPFEVWVDELAIHTERIGCTL